MLPNIKYFEWIAAWAGLVGALTIVVSITLS